MNIESSRSHSVFNITLESKTENCGIINVKTSMFNFVDLAGSERQKLTASTGERLKEAGSINKSLTVLGSVINSLVEIAEGKKVHIRYRDSKLTRILRDSLGGNSKTAIIANISPSSSSFGETLSTLKFAQRAKLIRNNAEINQEASGSIEVLKTEILRLKKEIELMRTLNNIGGFCSGDGKNIGLGKSAIKNFPVSNSINDDNFKMEIENIKQEDNGDENIAGNNSNSIMKLQRKALEDLFPVNPNLAPASKNSKNCDKFTPKKPATPINVHGKESVTFYNPQLAKPTTNMGGMSDSDLAKEQDLLKDQNKSQLELEI